MNTIIINLFGAPGSGKSTGASYIFSQLKLHGFNVELALEFAKEKVWEENKGAFKSQLYILGEQNYRLTRLLGKVDVIITDSPILLSCFYNQDTYMHTFDDFVLELFNTYHNRNYFITRTKEYNPKGRFQTEEEANQIATKLIAMLNNFHIPYGLIEGSQAGYDRILAEIYDLLEREE